MSRPNRLEKRQERLRILAQGPASPCISICQMDPETKLCLGCYRTIDEIREWMISSPEQKEEILHRIAQRRTML